MTVDLLVRSGGAPLGRLGFPLGRGPSHRRDQAQPHVGSVVLRIWVAALWAIVLVIFFRLALQDAHAVSVVPLGALLTTDVELVGLPAQTVKVGALSATRAVVANVVPHFLGQALCDLHARTTEL